MPTLVLLVLVLLPTPAQVVKLPPGATNISTSGPCEIHGMIMTDMAAEGKTTGGPSAPSVLTFQVRCSVSWGMCSARLVSADLFPFPQGKGRIQPPERRTGLLEPTVYPFEVVGKYDTVRLSCCR